MMPKSPARPIRPGAIPNACRMNASHANARTAPTAIACTVASSSRLASFPCGVVVRGAVRHTHHADRHTNPNMNATGMANAYALRIERWSISLSSSPTAIPTSQHAIANRIRRRLPSSSGCMSVLDLDAAHQHHAAEHECLGGIRRRRLDLAVDAAHHDGRLDDHAPVLGHLEID